MKKLVSLHVALLPFFATAQIPTDTTYSDTVTSHVLAEGEPVAGANISYMIIDTVKGTQELIREALTNESGLDIVDSLPVIKHYTGLQPFAKPVNKEDILIASNGTEKGLKANAFADVMNLDKN